ncbi:hypothetical protein M408DRAFT_158490 [Serendipita vermifera MAFF 305830]|uniref:Uncharacterized protein n=1 Tax=Serendipita vermifera MAFF 305830 TaxID=933852 RepID=A0A0C3BNK8_SERVB|nr:hypothetical protein M408DRAFT_158490 [Serendipita vermifera MAFF 305830]
MVDAIWTRWTATFAPCCPFYTYVLPSPLLSWLKRILDWPLDVSPHSMRLYFSRLLSPDYNNPHLSPPHFNALPSFFLDSYPLFPSRRRWIFHPTYIARFVARFLLSLSSSFPNGASS